MSPVSSLQVVRILEKHEPSRSSIGALSFLSGHASSSSSCGALRLGPIPADEASAVQNYVEHMLFLLMEEEAGQGWRAVETFLVLGDFWSHFYDLLRSYQAERWVPSWSLWFWRG